VHFLATRAIECYTSSVIGMSSGIFKHKVNEEKIISVRRALFLLFVISFFIFSPIITAAQSIERAGEPSDPATQDISSPPAPIAPEQGVVFYRAQVVSILEAGKKSIDGVPMDYQKIRVKILNGDEKGNTVLIDHGGPFAIEEYQKVKEGERVVIAKPTASAKADFYYVVDKYRTPQVLLVMLLFFAVAIFFGRKKGLTSLLGMLFSILVIFYFIIPRILSGSDPFLSALAGAAVILLVSLYVSHGFNRRTTIALVSTLGAFVLAIAIDLLFVYVTSLHGVGTEEAFYLQFGTAHLNLRGLLLGGIIIGVLGVLDDVTTSQVAAIEEIHTADPLLSFRALYKKGLSVGREHIASLVNTLVLAYAGASFPLLLLATTQKAQPFWLIFNSNFIGEEIVRTLVGSTTLILAVPLTTLFAAYYYGKSHP